MAWFASNQAIEHVCSLMVSIACFVGDCYQADGARFPYSNRRSFSPPLERDKNARRLQLVA
jgi:hypothetical protein